MTARFLIGDTRDVTATIPDGSVDLILTSPPFLALRSYLPADHPDKWREIGSEPTPAEFIDTLLALTAEWGRVLAPHGTIAIELGDTYSGSSMSGGDDRGSSKYPNGRSSVGIAGRLATYADQRGNPDGMRDTTFQGGNTRTGGGSGWPLAKCKAMIPELYRIALGYGINPLTGQPSPAGQWRVRNVVTWCRPNPPVGALGDKFRPATSDMVIACRSSTRWFDLDAVRVPLKVPEAATPEGARMNRASVDHAGDDRPLGAGGASTTKPMMSNPLGGPPLDYWVIPPGGYPGSHYAVYPPELCITPIEAMCPRAVCTTCGEPRRRIVERESTGQNTRTSRGMTDDPRQVGAVVSTLVPEHSRVTTLGWTDCGHDAWRNGVVLDPFVGSGTTLMVAHGHGRDSIGIDLDERNVALAQARLGMFLTVEDRREARPATDRPNDPLLAAGAEGW